MVLFIVQALGSLLVTALDPRGCSSMVGNGYTGFQMGGPWHRGHGLDCGTEASAHGWCTISTVIAPTRRHVDSWELPAFECKGSDNTENLETAVGSSIFPDYSRCFSASALGGSEVQTTPQA